LIVEKMFSYSNKKYSLKLILNFIGLWSLLLASACNNKPHTVRDHLSKKTPSEWSVSVSESESSNLHWLREFNDPRLTALVHEALDNNFDLKSVAARIAIFRSQASIEGAGQWPQLAFAPGYRRESESGSATLSAFTALFELNWELDVWGRIRDARQAADQETSAVAADYRSARLSLAARTAQTYFDLAEARLQTEAAKQSVRERSTIVDLVKGRFARGLTRGLDLRLALTDLSNAKAQLAQAQNQVQLVKRRLETLLGRYPSASLMEVLSLPNPPLALSAGIPSELLTRRPDLVGAFERLRAADLRVESARKALLPRITLTAAGGTSSAALAELIDPRVVAWNLAMGLLQPIFTGGRLMGAIDLNEARVEEALNQYYSIALNAFREVEQALSAEERLREQENALQEAVMQTRESQKLAVYSYRHGFIEILTLLDSYRSTLNAQIDHLVVKRQLLNNRIELYLALGGDV
jgi:NodT family efflux transporter outer membrane factor (OMF) lipoprotein